MAGPLRWMTHWWRVFGRALVSAYRNNCLGLAKGAAYSALLAFFPVLTTTATILVQANAEAVSHALSRLLFRAVPPGTEELVEYQFVVRGYQPAALLIGATVLAAWAASGVMMSLMEGFRAAYGIRRDRGVVRQRLVAIALVFLCGLPVIAGSALIVFGNRAERTLSIWLGWAPAGNQLRGGLALAGQAVRYALALASIAVAAAVLYRTGPNRRQTWAGVWPGAVVATLLWLLATTAFAWYVRNIARYNVLYGSVGAVIALLVWMYLLAIIALIGCEFNARRQDSRFSPSARRAASS